MWGRQVVMILICLDSTTPTQAVYMTLLHKPSYTDVIKRGGATGGSRGNVPWSRAMHLKMILEGQHIELSGV